MSQTWAKQGLNPELQLVNLDSEGRDKPLTVFKRLSSKWDNLLMLWKVVIWLEYTTCESSAAWTVAVTDVRFEYKMLRNKNSFTILESFVSVCKTLSVKMCRKFATHWCTDCICMQNMQANKITRLCLKIVCPRNN